MASPSNSCDHHEHEKPKLHHARRDCRYNITTKQDIGTLITLKTGFPLIDQSVFFSSFPACHIARSKSGRCVICVPFPLAMEHPPASCVPFAKRLPQRARLIRTRRDARQVDACPLKCLTGFNCPGRFIRFAGEIGQSPNRKLFFLEGECIVITCQSEHWLKEYMPVLQIRHCTRKTLKEWLRNKVHCLQNELPFIRRAASQTDH